MSWKPPFEAGTRFERLVVIEEAGRTSNGGRKYRCACDCGGETITAGDSLTRGVARSCGCLHREWATARGHELGKANTTHGLTGSPTYRTWRAMLGRCGHAGTNGYKYYGGRGVEVCDRWRSFENFLADMGERPEGKTLDRIDPEGNYEPDNCRWATLVEQARNRRAKA